MTSQCEENCQVKKVLIIACTILFLLPIHSEAENIAWLDPPFFESDSVTSSTLTERVIITFQNKINHQLLTDPAIEIHHEFEQFHTVSATIPTEQRKRLEKHETVASVAADPVVTTNLQSTGTETRLDFTTSQLANWGIQSVLADDAHAFGLTGKGVKIGVIDSGIYMDHPDLHIAGGVSFIPDSPTFNDDVGHGTHVAGIISALDNDFGAIGVAPDAELYAIKVMDKHGYGNQSDVAAGIEWAIAHDLDMINLSITSSQQSVILEKMIEKAANHGILLIAAAGNIKKHPQSYADVLYPARLASVIAVGSTNSKNHLSIFSYIGPSLELVAPGESIYSTYLPVGGREPFIYADGTSMAAPFVTGVAALYKEAYPNLPNKELRNLLQTTARDLGKPGKDLIFGYGLVQAPMIKNTTKFPDVKKDIWYESAITSLYNEGIIAGYEDGKFYPDRPVTRAEAITMIGKALQLDGAKQTTRFKDVAEQHFASGYIMSATKEKIITGFPGNVFKPNIPITRADVAVMLQNAFVLETEQTTPFKDVADGKYFTKSIQTLKDAQIANGYPDGTYRPYTNITRAEYAVLLSKIKTSLLKY